VLTDTSAHVLGLTCAVFALFSNAFSFVFLSKPLNVALVRERSFLTHTPTLDLAPVAVIGHVVDFAFYVTYDSYYTSMAQTTCCFYDWDYASAYASFCDASMLASMISLWATIRGISSPSRTLWICGAAILAELPVSRILLWHPCLLTCLPPSPWLSIPYIYSSDRFSGVSCAF
jgi:hypothetical protein